MESIIRETSNIFHSVASRMNSCESRHPEEGQYYHVDRIQHVMYSVSFWFIGAMDNKLKPSIHVGFLCTEHKYVCEKKLALDDEGK